LRPAGRASRRAVRAVHSRVRQESRDERHARNTIKQAGCAQGGCRHQAVCRENDQGSHEDVERAESAGQGRQSQGRVPTKLDSEHQGKLDDLKKLSGKELDSAYDRMQLDAHQEAVGLFTKYSQNGDNADLKQWATKTLPALKEHLSMAQKLK
jgi:Domain of unknown function (DUF4142)